MSGHAAKRLMAVGVGPGDPELMTVKGVKAIEQAAVVFAPVRHVGGESVALQCAAAACDLSSKRIVSLPFPDDSSPAAWGTVADRVWHELEGADSGVVLVEGDPGLFSSFGHLAAALLSVAPQLETAVVPGVTSVTAAGAAARLALGQHADMVAIVSATAPPARVVQALRTAECVVILKAAAALDGVIDALTLAGRLDEALFVERCTQPGAVVERDLRGAAAGPPRSYWSLVVVGGRRW